MKPTKAILFSYIFSLTTASAALAQLRAPPVISAQAKSAIDDATAPLGILNTVSTSKVFLKYMLAASGETDRRKVEIFDQASQWLRAYYAQPVTEVRVETLGQLAEVRAKMVHDCYTLEDEIEERNRGIMPPRLKLVTSAPEVLAELEAIKQTSRERMQEIAGARLGGDNKPSSQLLAQVAAANGLDAKALVPLLALGATPEAITRFANSPQTKLELVNTFSAGFDKAIDMIRGLGDTLASSPEIQLPRQDLQVFLSTIIGEYYKRAPRAMLQNILADLIEHPERDTLMERFETMVLNSGVQFQKLFQIYSRQEGFPDDLKAIFIRLEKNTKAVPWRLVERELKKYKFPVVFESIQQKPLAKATINQVHAAQVSYKGKANLDTVLRVRKPGAIESIQTDNVVLGEVATVLDSLPVLIEANFPKLAPFVGDLREMALIDTNIPKTTRNHLEIKRLYDGEEVLEDGTRVRIHVPWVVPLAPEIPMMVMERVKGMDFDEFIAGHPEEARKGAEGFVIRWLKVGFNNKPGMSRLHADAHLGNIMASIEGRVITIFPLDYGMVTSLTPRMQSKILGLGILVRTHEASFIARGLWDLSVKSENKMTFAQFQTLIEEKIKELNGKDIRAWPLPDWLAFASNNGLRLPYNLSYFNRGFLTVARLIKSVNSDLRTPTEMKKIMFRQPLQMLRMLFSSKEFSFFDWFKIIRLAATNKGGGNSVAAARNGDAQARNAAEGLRCEALFGAGK